MRILGIILLCSIIFIRFNLLGSSYDNGLINTSGEVVEYSIKGDLLSITLKSEELLKLFYTINDIEELECLNSNLKIGSYISFKGSVEDPGINTIPNTFNYKNYLRSINIYKVVNVDDLNIVDNDMSLINKIRNVLIRDDLTRTNAYMNALIFANQDLISSEVLDSYSINGISHLLAISGMHISLLVLILRKLLNKFKYYKIIIYSFLLFYLVVTNYPPSLIRAIIFFLSLDIFSYFKFRALDIFIYTILFILVISPNLILNIGFLYSVVISFYLIRVKVNKPYKLIKISILAFIISLPITINNNYEFNLLSPILNIFFVPLVSFIIYPLTLLTYLMPFLEVFYYLVISFMESVSMFVSQYSLMVIMPRMGIGFIIIYYLILFSYKEFKYKLMIYLVIILFLVKIFIYLDFNGYVYFIDVGQGDSSLIVSPYMKDIILIDSGGVMSYETNEWRVRNYSSKGDEINTFIKSLGISKIDLVILTHGDIDHVKDMKIIEEGILFKSVMINDDELNMYEELYINYNNYFNFSIIDFKVLDKSLYDNENDNSIVSLINIYDTSFLFLGDISKSVELEILSKYHLDIDILKLAHHGSNTSSDETFIRSLSPSLGIISAGFNNRFGHPHKEVIDILDKYRINYLNTGDVGTIVIKVNKKGYTIK